MKKLLILYIYISSVSFSSDKQIVTKYESEKLCNGIKNINDYVQNSIEIKKFHLGDQSLEKLEYFTDSKITEGIPFPFITSDVAKIIHQQDKISINEAINKIEKRFLTKNETFIKLNCLNEKNILHAKLKMKYYYYPEYNLLTAEIIKIKNKLEYGKGYIVLAKTDLKGKIQILKTTFWEE